MKQKLEWHRRAIGVMVENLSREGAALQLAKARYGWLCQDLHFAERQLAEAERRGLTAYDPDKLLVPRGRRK